MKKEYKLLTTLMKKTTYKSLDKINLPEDLRKLKKVDLESVCDAVSYTHLTLPTICSV